MQINLFKLGGKDNGHIRSVATGNSYNTLVEALHKGKERVSNCQVEWQFNPKTAKIHESLDKLYDEQMKHLREQYDILELSWGGGYDSSYLLEIAHRTNTQIDVISMMGIDRLENDHPQNKEFHWNYKHVERYLDKFPKTEIHFMDFNKMWEMIKHKENDWTQCYIGLDDICGNACDEYIGRKASDNRALLTGRGWKKIIYNEEVDCWSLFQPSSELNQTLSHSGECDVIYFYGSPDIVMTSSVYARDIARMQNINKGVWISPTEWMQQTILYKNLPFGIKRFPKWDNEFNHPKMSWYCKDSKPLDPILHKKYWDHISNINNSIHIDDLGGKQLPDGHWKEVFKLVDF